MPVEHIVLTTHAYEHKIFVPPFQRRYGTAQVWVVPRCAARVRSAALGQCLMLCISALPAPICLSRGQRIAALNPFSGRCGLKFIYVHPFVRLF
jgi:hypothetical protein